MACSKIPVCRARHRAGAAILADVDSHVVKEGGSPDSLISGCLLRRRPSFSADLELVRTIFVPRKADRPGRGLRAQYALGDSSLANMEVSGACVQPEEMLSPEGGYCSLINLEEDNNKMTISLSTTLGTRVRLPTPDPGTPGASAPRRSLPLSSNGPSKTIIFRRRPGCVILLMEPRRPGAGGE